MIPIPKSIANHNTKYLTLGYQHGGWVLLIIFILTLFRPTDFLVILLLCGLAFYHTRKIYPRTAHEVIDTGKGLLIKNHKTSVEIGYQDIVEINYDYYFFAFQNNAVKLTIKPHDELGDTVYFVSWADSSRYNKEFNLNPFAQTPETQAWIEHMKEKIKHG
ncbi:hypothetical protein LU290_02835 [Moraxella nasibovis]|uniref:hypothetical protein n=1 Tax=Moraxella nasibovis TaxID=2904120 RepID=UPI002410818C|nr:hypothetical protein [Moraxella nasibovis]WFF39179.1 hypothetical protein LU290_02835 [Moraxella nasibovis]